MCPYDIVGHVSIIFRYATALCSILQIMGGLCHTAESTLNLLRQRGRRSSAQQHQYHYKVKYIQCLIIILTLKSYSVLFKIDNHIDELLYIIKYYFQLHC